MTTDDAGRLGSRTKGLASRFRGARSTDFDVPYDPERMDHHVVSVGLTALATSIALTGCAQGSAGARVAALRDFARSLPVCASGEPAMSLADAMARTWKAGDRLVVRGHLSVVSFGPPCDSNTPPVLIRTAPSPGPCGAAPSIPLRSRTRFPEAWCPWQQTPR
jgi:hypothetical protein